MIVACIKMPGFNFMMVGTRVAPDTDLAGYTEFFFRTKCTFI